MKSAALAASAGEARDTVRPVLKKKTIVSGVAGLLVVGAIGSAFGDEPAETPTAIETIQSKSDVAADEAAAAAETTATEPEPEPTEEPAPERDPACEDVSPELLASIGVGAEDGTGLAMTRAVAYRSPDYAKVWFVAGEFTATGVDPQVGVWARNDLEVSGGITMAVDGMAQEFTVWPDADTTDAAISKADPSVAMAKECLAAS